MHEPPKNSLGCNPYFSRSYSLNQCFRLVDAYSSTEACAAATRAIGTLNGEQDT